jgi:RNA-directed DNA polymerase
VTTRLERFTQKAREEPRERFNALMGLLYEPEGLRESFGRQDGRKAPGVDGMSKEQYGEGLEERLGVARARE